MTRSRVCPDTESTGLSPASDALLEIAIISDVNATMFDRYLPFSCPLNTFVTDAVRFSPFHHH
ncbi:hypothetical protein B5V48_25120 [Salmonella enterica]|nr:hypothetical protein [Salmonella enterica]